ncbi:hypothetical protein [Rhodanobacter sp. MP7CTX1]|uniref:hypothetical protein n=1 Tax=Rhodanobacter sp. MP7CTX1 TaxID=2723084 RepID=UPI001607EE97|nr:hypothetical protein [Rhodanobacter sp. MP7CTX1]MBB6185875.1 hypothetical protein [Rhodanobacter sp. MP7CTX1]
MKQPVLVPIADPSQRFSGGEVSLFKGVRQIRTSSTGPKLANAQAAAADQAESKMLTDMP